MKKFFLFAAALLSAGVLSAGTVNVDITNGQQANGAAPVTLSVNGTELTVGYSFTSGIEWPNGGVEFNLAEPVSNVTNLAYDLIGDAANADWTSFHVYLKDTQGTRWAVSPTASIGGAPTTWTTYNVLPSSPLWSSVSYLFDEAEIVAVGFLVNPAANQTGSFQLRNIAITYTEGQTGPKVEHIVDLSLANHANGDEAANVSWTLNAQNELMVSYNLGAWGNDGPEFALPNLKDVKDMQFEFIGDGALSSWTSFQVYLKDQNGIRWYNESANLHLSGVGSWSMEKYMPHDELWTSGATQGDTFVAIGFLANPMNPTASTFGIRNVKINLNSTETAVENVETVKVQKIIENGQLVIIRDGVRYDVLGK